MNITDILRPDCVRVPLLATEKTEAIIELIDLLDGKSLLKDREAVLHAVLAREQTRSTGIGLGLAVPHGKSPGCDSLVMCIGKPARPIDFGSPDGRDCGLIALLASPVDKTGPHIQALAGISRLWQSDLFRASILEASGSEELYAAIRQFQ